MDAQPRQRPLIGRLAVGLAVAGGVLGAVAPAHAASVGGFGAFPAPRSAKAPTLPYFALRLARGRTTKLDAIVVNSSPRPIELAVSPVAGLTGQTSGAVYGNAAKSRTDGLVVVPLTSDLTLRPHSRRRVPVRLTVDRTAAPGDHLAGIAVADRHHRHSGGHFSVTEVIRVVIGLSVRVPGHTSASLRIGHLAAGPLGGTPDASVNVPVRNSGTVYCRPRLAVRLASPGARVVETRALDTLLPGARITYPFPWRHVLRSGTYTAAVTATGCGRARHLRQVLLVRRSRPAAVPRSPAPAPAPAPRVVTRAVTHSGVSWPVIALVGIGGLLVGVLASRRRRRTPPPGPPTPVPAASGS